MKIVVLILSIVVSVSTYGQADFSGKWRLNLDKTQFNETPGTPAAARLVVQQEEGVITFQRNDRPKEKLRIDSMASIDISEGDNRTKVSMKFASDNKGLVETRIYTYPEGTRGVFAVRKIRTWTLSNDTNTLTIHDHIETNDPSLSYNMVLIYERQ